MTIEAAVMPREFINGLVPDILVANAVARRSVKETAWAQQIFSSVVGVQYDLDGDCLDKLTAINTAWTAETILWDRTAPKREGVIRARRPDIKLDAEFASSMAMIDGTFDVPGSEARTNGDRVMNMLMSAYHESVAIKVTSMPIGMEAEDLVAVIDRAGDMARESTEHGERTNTASIFLDGDVYAEFVRENEKPADFAALMFRVASINTSKLR